jgi:hypothetical protein
VAPKRRCKPRIGHGAPFISKVNPESCAESYNDGKQPVHQLHRGSKLIKKTQLTVSKRVLRLNKKKPAKINEPLFQVAFDFPLYFPRFYAFALIMEFLSFAQAYFHFGKAVFVDEHIQGHYGKALFFDFILPLGQFFLCEQELSLAHRCVTCITGIHVLSNMQALYPQFTRIVEEAVTVVETDPAQTHRLDFGPCEHNTRFESVFYGILKGGGAVFYKDVIGQVIVY